MAPALSSCSRPWVSSVINSLRSTHSSPVRRHAEVFWLRGPESQSNIPRNTPKSVSSAKQSTIQASSSVTGTPTSLSISGSLPGPAACSRHEISGFDSRDSAASGSPRFRRVMTSPGGRVSGSEVALSGSSVALGVWVLAGSGVFAALRSGVAVESACGVSAGIGASIGGLGADVAASVVAGTVATACLGVGAWSPQAIRAVRIKTARSSRVVLSIFLTGPQHYGVPVRHAAFYDNRLDGL